MDFSHLAYTLIPVSAAIIGAIIAVNINLSPKLVSAIQHFAAGVVFAAAAGEILPDVMHQNSPLATAIGGTLGLGVMLAIKQIESYMKGPVGLLTMVGVDIFIDGMVLGIGFSNIVGFRVAKNLGGEKAMGIAAHREALLPYADIFVGLVLVSGLTMLWSIGGGQGLPIWFHIKMGAVAIWLLAYILMRLRIRKFLATRDMSLLKLIRTYAHIIITAVVLAVIFAVLTFSA